MEEENIPKKKPDTSFNRRLSVAKNPDRNMTTVKKNVKIFILQGNMTKGEYGKGYYGIFVQTICSMEYEVESLTFSFANQFINKWNFKRLKKLRYLKINLTFKIQNYHHKLKISIKMKRIQNDKFREFKLQENHWRLDWNWSF